MSKVKSKVLMKVVTAPQDWICDECGAVIKRGEKCVKMGKRKMCGKHIKERGQNATGRTNTR